MARSCLFFFLSFGVDSHSLLMVFAVCGRYVVQQLQHPPTSRLHLWHLSMESFRVRWLMEVPFKTIRWVYHGSSQIRTAPWTTDDILKFSLEFFGRKKLKKYHHAPNSTALILYNKDNIQKQRNIFSSMPIKSHLKDSVGTGDSSQKEPGLKYKANPLLQLFCQWLLL